MKKPSSHASIFFRGFLFGIILCLLVGVLPEARGQKPSQLEILHNISTQNYYHIQKMIALQNFSRDLMLEIAQRTKVKPETVAPLTNRLQQEMFNLDLKLQELNK
jgi:hypothetical protein